MNSLFRARLALLGFVLAACSSKSSPPVGNPCLMNSDCASALVCTFGHCHTACATARDCPTGQLCLKGSDGASCQPPAEAHCLYHSDCPMPLTCALDRQCRAQCQTDVDCATSTQSCVLPDHVCAEAIEVDPTTHHLRNAQPPVETDAGAAPDASPDVADQSCVPSSTMCMGKKSAVCMNGIWVVANSDCATGCDPGTGACRVCPASTCKSMRVIFHGAVNMQPDVQLAIDDGKVARTSNEMDPMIGQQTLLFGNFTDDHKQWTTDNTACGLPNYAARTNVYYLAQKAAVAVASSWYGDAADYADQMYCQSCPNFGCDNSISTPKRIDKIEVLANSGDASCKVCLYRGDSPASATLVRCLGPNTSVTGADLDPAKAPSLIQLDDGQQCASY